MKYAYDILNDDTLSFQGSMKDNLKYWQGTETRLEEITVSIYDEIHAIELLVSGDTVISIGSDKMLDLSLDYSFIQKIYDLIGGLR